MITLIILKTMNIKMILTMLLGLKQHEPPLFSSALPQLKQPSDVDLVTQGMVKMTRRRLCELENGPLK